ncbi:MAG: hypothetical protein Q8R78_02540 [Candidatus Omnitrophota bacterium]|nr:hypothetical protein [Candidatus Omnitrophota bacterium]
MSINRKSSLSRSSKSIRYVELRPRGRRWLVVLVVDGVSVGSRNVRSKSLAWLAAELLCNRGR